MCGCMAGWLLDMLAVSTVPSSLVPCRSRPGPEPLWNTRTVLAKPRMQVPTRPRSNRATLCCCCCVASLDCMRRRLPFPPGPSLAPKPCPVHLMCVYLQACRRCYCCCCCAGGTIVDERVFGGLKKDRSSQPFRNSLKGDRLSAMYRRWRQHRTHVRNENSL